VAGLIGYVSWGSLSLPIYHWYRTQISQHNPYSRVTLFLLLQIYGNGQQVLERHRYSFPAEWLYAENVAGEWGAFSDIMKRKEANIQVRTRSPSQLHLL